MGQAQRAIDRGLVLEDVILQRTAELVGGRRAGHDDGTAAQPRKARVSGKEAYDTLERAEIGGPVEARPAGGNHLICGSFTITSMSSWALAKSIIEPAAADDASHAERSSPEIAAWRRVFTALPARFTALVSSA